MFFSTYTHHMKTAPFRYGWNVFSKAFRDQSSTHFTRKQHRASWLTNSELFCYKVYFSFEIFSYNVCRETEGAKCDTADNIWNRKVKRWHQKVIIFGNADALGIHFYKKIQVRYGHVSKSVASPGRIHWYEMYLSPNFAQTENSRADVSRK